MRQKTFWMVWRAGGFPPSFKHESLQAATQEAERLARLNGGETFVVLEAVCARRTDNLIRIDFDSESEIPF